MNKQDENAKLNERALWYLDKLLLVVPEFSNFSIESSLGKMNLTESECVEMYTLSNDIRKLLIDKLGYAELVYDKPNFTLTELGRKVKSKGGHFQYLENLNEKEAHETDRQKLKDSIDQIELYKKSWEYKYRKLPYFVSVLTLIGTTFSISIAYQQLLKKTTPKDLQETQQQIQIIKSKMFKIDSLYQLDTIRK